MTRIRCRERKCTFNKNGICASDEIEYEPDAGCLTMELREDVEEEEEFDDEDAPDKDLDEEWDDEEEEEDEDEDWGDADEREDDYLGGRSRKR
ncbi:MAG: hypothetical protein L0Y55_15090 [Anaerolineales bacterium]|nr:hypothetical protein [Anaerolineales bacterium]